MSGAPDIGTAGDDELRESIRVAVLAYMARHDGEPIGRVSGHLGIVCLEFAAAAIQAAGVTPDRFAHLARKAFVASDADMKRTMTELHAVAQPAPGRPQ